MIAKLLRMFHRTVAAIFYALWPKHARAFWMECPRCHGRFGGHQAHGRNLTEKREGKRAKHWRVVCGGCACAINGAPTPRVRRFRLPSLRGKAPA